MFNTITSSYAFPFMDFTKTLEEIFTDINGKNIHWNQIDSWVVITADFKKTIKDPEISKAFIWLIKTTDFYKNHQDSKMAYYPIYEKWNIVYWWGFLDKAYDNLIKIELTITDSCYSFQRYPLNFSYTLADKIVLEADKIRGNAYLDGDHCNLEDPEDVRTNKQEQFNLLYNMACSLFEEFSFTEITPDEIKERFIQLINIGNGKSDFTSYNNI